MTTPALKPCPFCGGKAMLLTGRYAEDAMETWVECASCNCSTDRVEDAYSDQDTAAAIWNNRHPSTEFSDWLNQGPKLAHAAGCYVGIKVTALQDQEPR